MIKSKHNKGFIKLSNCIYKIHAGLKMSV